jgi:hypothetical protein
VVVGIGGIPDNPEELFIIPLQEVETINPHFDFMKHYQRHEVNKMFFFD